MKKIVLMILVLLVTFLSFKPTYAYENLTDDLKVTASTVNMSIIDSASTNIFGSTGYYWFLVEFARPVTGAYILTGDFYNSSVFLSTNQSSPTINQLITNTAFTALNNDLWFLYIGTTNTRFSAFVYNATSATLAQAQLQTYIDDYFYLYIDTVNTVKQTVIDTFFSAYHLSFTYDSFEEGFNLGFQRGVDYSYKTIYDNGFENVNGYIDEDSYIYETAYDLAYQTGYLMGLEDGEESGYTEGYLDGFDVGYDAELDFTNILDYVFKPFDILEKELAFGITIGAIAFIPIMFGVMTLLFSLKRGKK